MSNVAENKLAALLQAELRNMGQAFRSPEGFGFALLVLIAAWASIFAPRVMAAVLPVTAALALGGYIYARRGFPRLDIRLGLFLILMTGLIALSALWSGHDADGLEKTGKIAGVFLSGLVLYACARELPDDQRARLRRLLVGGFCFGFVLLVVNMLTGASLYRLVTMKNSLDVAGEGANRAAVVMSIMLWPAMLAAWKCGWRRLALVLPFATLLATFLTESQSSQIAILLGGLVILLGTVLPRLTLVLVALAGVAVLVLMPFAFVAACPSMLQMDIGWREASAGARLEIWCAVSNKIFDLPIFGHGLDAARFVQDWGINHLYFPDKTILHPHNAALQLWYEAGALGVLVVCAVWLGLIWRIASVDEERRTILLASLLGILLIACVSHGLWQSWWLGTLGILPALFSLVLPRR